MKKLQTYVVDLTTTISKEALRTVSETLIEQPELNRPSLERCLTHHHSKALLRQLLTAAEDNRVSADRLAGMIEGASAIVDHYEDLSPELVWTGPAPAGSATRQTEQVMLEVIRDANRVLFLTSYVAYKVDGIVRALNQATNRGVEVKILLESSDGKNRNRSLDYSLSSMKEVLPKARFYVWKNQSEDFTGGSVHAKVAVADEHLALVTSANLTGHAMEKNIEAGVLLKGDNHPKKLSDYLNAMVTNGLIDEL